MSDRKVTVFCIAYNHENYIRQCLESIIMQKTDFAFKVVVHDDASTDKTAEIIRDFEQKYPDIIKPIYQTENQFSKKISIYKEFLLPQIEGDYVAFLEGDDYWTDPDKLQIQADFLDKHPQCSACGHNTTIIKESEAAKETLKNDICGGEEGYLSTETVIDWGYILHLSSIMYRTKFAGFPEFVYSRYDMLDMPMSVYLRFCGDIYRFGKTMSVYRFMVANSWSETQRGKLSAKKSEEGHKNQLEFYLRAEEFSDYKYKEVFAKHIIREASYLPGARKIIFSKYKEYYKLLRPKRKIRYFFIICFPRSFRFIKTIRKKAKRY